MKILLTGYNGLIGSQVHRILVENGYEVYCLGLSEPKSAYIVFYQVDLSSDWNIDEIKINVDMVIHLAQSPYFRNFPTQASHIFNVNSYTSLKLCDYGIRAQIKKIIFTSSAGIYGSQQYNLNETKEIVYNSNLGFYLASKHIAECLILNYNSFFNTVILRPFFVYGKEQKKDMLIPRLIENIKQCETITLKGNDGIWINPAHVSDAAKAIYKCINLAGNEIINIAGPKVHSLREICEIIGKQLNMEPKFLTQESESPEKLIGDIAKMKKLLIEPTVSFEEGIKSFF